MTMTPTPLGFPRLSAASAAARKLRAALIAICTVISSWLIIPTSAGAATFNFFTALGPELPGQTGAGFATVSFDDVANTLSINASFSGLSGNSTVAHIHCCVAVPGTGTVAVAVTPGTLPGFPVGVKSGSYTQILNTEDTATYTAGFITASGGTLAGAEARLFAGLLGGTAYFNIHSTTFGAGEIRGFLTETPVPAALPLFASALIGGGVIAWRRRRNDKAGTAAA